MRCPHCHHEAPTVMVHGHIQCLVCKQNISPCCSGEVELKWHPYDTAIPAGWSLAQGTEVQLHHNEYQFLIGRVVEG